MDITIKRVAATNAVFGVMLDDKGTPFAVTLERDWLDNKQQVSCIPAGQYLCKRVKSPKFGNTFEITGVPGRSHILFHVGNREKDSLGCILIAESFSDFNGEAGVAFSSAGYKEFMQKQSGVNSFTLTIMG